MNCGEVEWWREPDLKGLLFRHGQIEHLAVQLDFSVQVWRDPRAEYSIPGASKNLSGNTGYADIVSIETGEIWEIKPKYPEPDGEEQALKEAAWYVKNAKVSCGLRWHVGNSFTTSGLFGGGGVVYQVEGNGNKAQLIAQQGRPGTVLYFWRYNGKEVKLSELSSQFSYFLKKEMITDYFTAGQPPKPLDGSKPPNNFPPGKFKPPVLWPDGCIPQLGKSIPGLIKSIHTTCAQTVLENSAVAILLEINVINALVGREVVAKQISTIRVPPVNPRDKLYREALGAILGASVAHGAIALAFGLTAAVALLIEGAVLVGGVIIVSLRTALAVAPALVPEGLMGTFAASVRAAQALRMPVAAGAALVAFAIPRASLAEPNTPVAFDVSFAKFVVLKPREANVRVGQSKTIDGVEWIVAGVAKTLPDSS
jgi:hypothetical protein